MEKNYKGLIVEESLDDNRILNRFNVIGLEVTESENPAERWHIFQVKAGKNDIELLAKHIADKKWYAHFWSDDEILVVFQHKMFAIDRHNDKKGNDEAVKYGLNLGIPKEQLDFLIPF